MFHQPPIDSFAFAVIALLAVVVPLAGLVEFRLLDRWIRRGRSLARIRFYVWIIAFEWVLTLGLLTWWFGRGGGLEELGLVPRVTEFQWIGVVLGLGGVYLIIDKMNEVLDDRESLDAVASQLGRLGRLAPHNDREQNLFLWVSLSAGICEEILYRGILTHVLTPAVGYVPALLLVVVIFALGHVYQGWEGALKTGIVGCILGALAWATGSLYISMILHAVLDLTSGRMLQAAVAHRDRKNHLEF